MQLDFWNNPIVVSAFRVRYRRSGLFNVTTIYLMLVLAGGMVLYYYRQRLPMPWPKVYLMCIVGVQFVMSFMQALTATGTSIRSEVVNRTLDFQRLAAMSPQRILVGKLMGEPAMAYLLTIAAFPFAAYCVTMGVSGVSLGNLLLLYLNILTSIFLISALGLIQPLEVAAGRSPAGFTGQNASWGGVALVFVMQAAIGANWLLAKPAPAAFIGLTTPMAPYFGILMHDDPWHFALSVYGLRIPFLLVTPISQLLLAYLCFHIMVRRLINPLNPSISKKMAYLILIMVDLLAGAILSEPIPLGMPLVMRCATFCLVHIVTALWLTTACTPWRESLHSWMWRYRGRSAWLFDLWIGARSANGLAIVTFSLLGILCIGPCLLLPFAYFEGVAAMQAELLPVLGVIALSTLLLLTYGILYQLCVALVGRGGRTVCATLLLILTVPQHLLGSYFNINILLELSPSAHFAAWFNGAAPLNPIPLVLTYGAGLAVIWYFLRRYMRGMERIIDKKLQAMGVPAIGA